MLPFSLNVLTDETFRRICAERWTEGQQLDFKAELPGMNDKAKDEFLKDVSAMANAEGGDLVYGVAEDAGHAAAVQPIIAESADNAMLRLGQMLDSSLEPRVWGLQMRAYTVDEGFVLVVRVPASFDGPHRYTVNGRQRFVLRNHTHTPDMTYDQLRQAFARTGTLRGAAEAFVAARAPTAGTKHAKYITAVGPYFVLHVIPLSGVAGRVRLDIAALHEDYQGFVLPAGVSFTRSTNRDGLAVHEPAADHAHHFAQVMRNGTLEAMRIANYKSGDVYAVPAVWAADFVKVGVEKYAAAAAQLDIAGPAVVSLSLINAVGCVLATSPRTTTRDTLDVPTLFLEPVEVADITNPGDVYQLIKPMMDMLYQSFDVHRCELYDAEGRWIGAPRR